MTFNRYCDIMEKIPGERKGHPTMTIHDIQKQFADDIKQKEAAAKDLRIKISEVNQSVLDAQADLDRLLSKEVLDPDAIEKTQAKIRTYQTISDTYTSRLDKLAERLSYDDAAIYAKQLYNAVIDEDTKLLTEVKPHLLAILKCLADYDTLSKSYAATLSAISSQCSDVVRMNNSYSFTDPTLKTLNRLLATNFPAQMQLFTEYRNCTDPEIFFSQRKQKV